MTASLVTALVIAATSGALAAQAPVFRTDTDLVLVDVMVTRDGRSVRGLTTSDFELRDNGVLQEIRFIDQGELPVRTILVCDASSSIVGSSAAGLQRALDVASSQVRDQDTLELIVFSGEVSPRERVHPGGRARLNGLFRGNTGGTTALRDALFSALAAEALSGERTMILALTDGRDNAGWLSADDLLLAARRANATIYAITPRGSTDVLTDVTRATSGRVFSGTSVDEMEKGIRDAFDDFRHRYVLGFAPLTPRAGWHDLDVKVSRDGEQVRFRPGYQIAPAGQTTPP
jgi:VWFA-related protein